MDIKKEFIDFMLSSGVLTFGDFVTKSGRRTPYFINTGNYRRGAQLARLGGFYAASVVSSGEEIDALFGPAYKGIPLAAVAAAALYLNHGVDLPYCFNRKEAKDHGEGGLLVGCAPKDGDRIAIIEDVTTAGTSVRETAALLRGAMGLDVTISALYISVDRCERGAGALTALTALDELKAEYGVRVYPIVTARDIIEYLPRGDARRAAMEAYLREYGTL
ncbi:MAG: orotate phosphoribosyltransferase [Oscillospiraceae bacterium]|jgi:orotate phosphoribosyltransferase|nr:orotate phosphoribosyltransferase [Oscillospiraceae bacterium]